MLRRVLVVVALVAATALGLAHGVEGQTPESQKPLRIAIPGDDGSLTPYTFESGYAFMSLVYDTLTWRDAAGNAKPWLARSITRDASGLFVTVRLRPDVKWHDGRPLTGADVVFTYAYMKDHPHPRFTPELQDIASVTPTTNPLIVRFNMQRRSLGLDDQPFADVPILPRHLWAGLGDRRAPAGLPVGTGPYRLTRHQRGRSYRFVANRDYFRGAPSVPRIDVPVIGREDELADELLRRRIDAAPITVAPGATLPAGGGLRVSDEISYTGTMLLFNVDGRPFNRPAARRAVARALNLDTIAGNATGVAGGVIPADRGMVHPRSPWARQAGALHSFDRAAARLAFAEQGIGAFRVAAPRNDPVRLETGKRVVRALRDAGARARLVELSPTALDRVLGRRRARATFDAAVLGIPALVSYDPSFLRALFGDPSVASLNDGGYRSDGFDSLAARAASARTATERRGVATQQLKLLARELPAVPLHFGGGTIVYRPATYDRWIGVRGTGILDKRSFLRGQTAQTTGTARSVDPRDLTDDSDDQGFSLVPIIIGFAVLVLAGAVWWLRPGRR